MPTSRPVVDAVVLPVSSSMTEAWVVEYSCPLTKTLPNAVMAPVETAPGFAADRAEAVPTAVPDPPPHAPNIATAAALIANATYLALAVIQISQLD
jgi:hypothetical protein